MSPMALPVSFAGKLPIGEGAVQLASDGQVGALVGILCGERFVDVDAEAGRVARDACSRR